MARRDPLFPAGCRRQLRVAGPLNGSCFSRCQATICAWSSMSCSACRSACFHVFDSFREPLTWPFRFGVSSCLTMADSTEGTALCRGQELILRRERLLTLPGGSFPSCRMRTSRRIAERSFDVLARGHTTQRLIRERHTDEQLSALITEHWNEAGRSASRMLRYFRDELGIACEQARFARLFARAQGGAETAL